MRSFWAAVPGGYWTKWEIDRQFANFGLLIFVFPFRLPSIGSGLSIIFRLSAALKNNQKSLPPILCQLPGIGLVW